MQVYALGKTNLPDKIGHGVEANKSVQNRAKTLQTKKVEKSTSKVDSFDVSPQGKETQKQVDKLKNILASEKFSMDTQKMDDAKKFLESKEFKEPNKEVFLDIADKMIDFQI